MLVVVSVSLLSKRSVLLLRLLGVRKFLRLLLV
jgi:hypothetical protein